MEMNVDKSMSEKIKDMSLKNPESGKKKKSKPEGGDKPGALLTPPPAYIEHRIQMFDRLMAKYKDELARKENIPIRVTLPDGKVVEACAWKDSPYDVAFKISKRLAEDKFISKVDGEVWDMKRPLEKSCRLELLDFEDEEAKAVFWHSTAHMLGEAMELKYGCHLCYGPPIKDGFYYDAYMTEPDQTVYSQTDFPVLEAQ
eukprot:Sdes_comp22659_c0_seq1m21078